MTTSHEQYHHTHNEADHEHLIGNLHAKARLGFVRKVFGILAAELIFTALWIIAVKTSPSLLIFVTNNQALGVLFAVIAFVGTLTLSISKNIARTVPYNYSILGAVIFSMAWSVSYLCTFYSVDTIMLAAIATASSVTGIYFYAQTTTAQYNYAKAFLYSSLFILAFQLFSLFFMSAKSSNFWLSVIISLSTCVSILFHTEAILGKKSVHYSQDDYVQAAMNLYIEIIQLFIELLKIIDKLKKTDKDKKKKRND